MGKPIFVCIEGPDGIGKGIQSSRLQHALVRAGYDARLDAEPTTGEIGMIIRRALAGNSRITPAALRLLFAADRMQHSEHIVALLARGISVVCDRYDLSNVVYQWATDGSEGAVSWARGLSRGCVVPDLTIVLLASPEVCRARLADRGRGDIYDHNQHFQERVHAGYRISDALLGRPVSYIDATGTPDEVAERVWAVVVEEVL